MGNLENHDPFPQGDPNRVDPSRQRQGRGQWNQPPEQAPSPVCDSSPAEVSMLCGDSGSLTIASQYLPSFYCRLSTLRRRESNETITNIPLFHSTYHRT
jgi:hypothetical protein